MNKAQIGDVLYLPDSLGEIEPGFYAVVDVDWMVTLSRLAENEDGDLSMTCRQFKVTYDEFAIFVPTDLQLETLDEEGATQ